MNARTSTVTTPSRVVPADTWPGTRALATSPYATTGLNLDQCLGQRQATWTFTLIDGITGQNLGELTPVRQPAVITHDTSRTIKRDLRIGLTASDAAQVNHLRDRVLPYLHIAGVAFPLGRYMVADPTTLPSTGGDQGLYTLLDEMFIVDQQIENGFSSDRPVHEAVRALLATLANPLPRVLVDPSEYPAVGGWGAGTTRGQVLAALATQGDYETPWMDHEGRFRMVRTVDPDQTPAVLDMDNGRRVISGSIAHSSDEVNAPNRFVVVGNSGSAEAAEVVGVYDVPASASHSITNRGFVIPYTTQMQVASPAQAQAAARNLGLRNTVFEFADLETVPDPRHDSYDVIHWQGRRWLELAWSMTCEEGAPMRHSLRRAIG